MYGDRRGGGFGQRRQHFVPVKVGDELDVKIEAVGEKGDGIAKKDGFVLFIPGAKQGDEVKVRVTKVLRKVGFADVVGKATGEIPQAEPAAEASAEGAQVEQAPVEEPLPGEDSQDSEDFGEEPATEEAPVEQAPAEEPVEEKKEE